MQAMSRRGISEHRQRSMVAMLMFLLADPTAVIRLASARPGSLILSLTLWLRSSFAILSCVRSYLMEKPATETRGQWLSCRCNRARFDVQFCQGSWFIHACLTDRFVKLAEPAKHDHRRGMHGACAVQLSLRASWHVLPDGLRFHVYVGIQSLPRRAGVTWTHSLRQAFCVAHVVAAAVFLHSVLCGSALTPRRHALARPSHFGPFHLLAAGRWESILRSLMGGRRHSRYVLPGRFLSVLLLGMEYGHTEPGVLVPCHILQVLSYTTLVMDGLLLFQVPISGITPVLGRQARGSHLRRCMIAFPDWLRSVWVWLLPLGCLLLAPTPQLVHNLSCSLVLGPVESYSIG